ncbi:WD40-repeat-containing domain protein [Zopfochytrium polystomum]|nr:WD40-repeat-containing domain protein [Zopfochytrium polystomum]
MLQRPFFPSSTPYSSSSAASSSLSLSSALHTRRPLATEAASAAAAAAAAASVSIFHASPSVSAATAIAPSYPLSRVRFLPSASYTPGSAYLVTTTYSTPASACSLALWRCHTLPSPGGPASSFPSAGDNPDSLALVDHAAAFHSPDAAWTASALPHPFLLPDLVQALDVAVVAASPSSSATAATADDDADDIAAAATPGASTAPATVVVAGASGRVAILAVSPPTTTTPSAAATSAAAAAAAGIRTLATPLLHTHPSGARAACTGVSVQPIVHTDRDLASVGDDGRVRFSKLDGGGRVSASAAADSARMTGVRWRTADEVVVATDAGRIKVVDRRMERAALTLYDAAEGSVPLNCIDVHPTQAIRVATGNSDGTVKVWDLRSLKQPEVKAFNAHSGEVWEVLFNPDDAKRVMSCGEDGITWNSARQRGATEWTTFAAALRPRRPTTRSRTSATGCPSTRSTWIPPTASWPRSATPRR